MTGTMKAHVLVGVAGDHEVESALDYAAVEATRRGCGVHLVHVLHPALVDGREIVELRKVGLDLLGRAERHVRKQVDEPVVVSTELVHGVVVSSLVSCSADACLVVLQRHHRGMLARLSALSVASGVAARAHTPVVVVPTVWRRPDGGQEPVVVGVEDVDTGQHLARMALEEARRWGAPLRLVQCWWISEVYDDIVFGDRSGPGHTARLHRQLNLGFAPLLAEYADVPTEIVVIHAPPADALVSESRHAALMVVGRHHPSVAFGSHLGPITRTVLKESTCPVLVVEPVAHG